MVVLTMPDNIYMAFYMNNRYHERRQEAIVLLGGKCVACGSVTDLHIDHIDPKTKTFPISRLFSRGRERYLRELKLCQLLCEPCHKEKTKAQHHKTVGHGEGKTGKRNCYCDKCAPLKRAYQKQQKGS